MEFMAALQGNFDDHKPSLFELLSEQQLASLLPPSLRYLLTVATQQHPRYLLRILNSFDELYALTMLLVERHFLKTYGGGFTENFYWLKREKTPATGAPARAQVGAPGAVRAALALSETDIWKNLAMMVALPYLKRKLDESHDINAPRALLGAAYTRLLPHPTATQRLLHCYRWFLRHVYPGVNAVYYFSLLAFNLAYLFDNSAAHSPFLWLIGTRMRRLGAADYRALADMSAPPSASQPAAAGATSSSSLLHRRPLSTRLLSGLRFVLPTSIFALKFLEWWHASDFARQLSRKAAEGLVLPPPIVAGLSKPQTPTPRQAPSKRPFSSSTTSSAEVNVPDPPISSTSLLPILTVPPSAESQLCPICSLRVQTPTACQTGFVFCYTCIHRWLAGEHEHQLAFMAGGGASGASGMGSRESKWESGKGRCAVTGRRVLGGTEGLRRVMV
jgi:peroxin-12